MLFLKITCIVLSQFNPSFSFLMDLEAVQMQKDYY